MPSGNGAKAQGTSTSDALITIVLRLVRELDGAVRSLLEVYADRLRLSVRRKVVAAALLASAGVCAVVLLAAAVLAVLRGARGGLTVLWGGREWLGDLTGGLLVLALTAGSAALGLRLSARRELEKLETKYERIRVEHEERASGTPGADDRGAARTPGSALDPGADRVSAACERGPVGRG